MLAAINWTFHFGHTKTNAVIESVQQITQTQTHTHMLESILGFFTFGALGFWIMIAVLSIIYTIAVEKDIHGWAIGATIIAAILGWDSLFGPEGAVWHWRALLLGIVIYGIAGGAWSVFRWFKYCRKYIEEHRGKERGTDAAKFYAEQLKPSDHKSRLIAWIVYWPWSLVWNVVGDFFTGIYDALANVYNRVAASVIKKALNRP